MPSHGFNRNHSSKKTLVKLLLIFIVLNLLAIFNKTIYDLAFFSGPIEAKKAVFRTKNIALGYYNSFAALYNLLTVQPAKQYSRIPTFELFITEQRLATLNAHLPQSGDEYQSGQIRVGDEIYNVDLKYRGDNSYHWGGDFKSWAVKFKKADRLHRFRYLHLINPRSITGLEMLTGFALAKRLNLLVPPADLARLFVNGRYQGVVQAVMRPDESVLRANRVMPGNFYDIEPNGIWEDAKKWNKIAVSNYFPEDYYQDFQNFLSMLYKINHEPYAPTLFKQLASVANIDKIIDLWIVHNIAGSMHQDHSHNQKWYVDPLTGKAEPMAWDVWGHGQYYELKEDLLLPTTEPHLALLRFGPLVTKKNSKLYHAVTEDIANQQQKKYIENLFERSKEDLDASPIIDKGYMTVPPFRPLSWPRFKITSEFRKILSFIEKRNAILAEAAARVHVEIMESPPGRYTINLQGQTGAEIVSLEFLNNMDSPDLIVQFAQQNKVVFNAANTGHKMYLPARAIFIHPSFGLIPDQRWHSSFKVAELVSSIEMKTSQEIRSITFRNLSNNETFNVEPKNVTQSSSASVFETIKNIDDCVPPLSDNPCRWTYQESVIEIPPKDKMIKYGPGRIQFKTDMEFSENETVVILPGTDITLFPGISLIFRGPVYAQGTEAEPVKFKTTGVTESWKMISLIGPRTAGSQLNHCQFTGGTGGVHQGVYYTGAVNIIYTDNITIADSLFTSNQPPSDDLLHIAKSSDVKIIHSQFTDSSADAIDADIADVEIFQNKFDNIKNDSIDLMESRAFIKDNVLMNAADKGISAGEGSQIVVSKNRFQNNDLAIAVKDQSWAHISDNLFVDNETDIAGYKKSEYYTTGGAIMSADNTILKKGRAADISLNMDDFSCINQACLNNNLPIRKSAKELLKTIYTSHKAEPDHWDGKR